MNERDKLIEKLIQEKGGTRQQYLSLLDQIAYHESAHTMDPKVKQYGGGPGRGKYQFEEGKNQGGITAARRTKRYLESIGESVPKWLETATQGNSLDATQLNAEQQDILYLGNMRMHPKADFGKVMKGEESVEDFWANYHWAGAPEDREKRLDSFRNSSNQYAQVEPKIERIKKDIVEPARGQYASTQIDNIQKPQQQQVEPTLRQPHQWEMLGRVEPSVEQIQQQVAQESQPKHQVAQLNSKQYGDLYGYLKANKETKLTQYNQGGRHEQNKHGGVPIGVGANGKPNTVEEGETSYNFGEDKFVFSDRISVRDKNNGTKLVNTPIDNTFAYGGETDPPTKKPVYVNNTDDPRYKSYQDSLALYNSTGKQLNSAKQTLKDVNKNMSEKYGQKLDSRLVKKGTTPFNETTNGKYYKEVNEFTLNHPSNIKPIGYDNYARTLYNADGTFDEFNGSKIPTTKIPVYKKPEQPVLIQPRDKVNPIQVQSAGITPAEITGDVYAPTKKAPVVDSWDLKEYVMGPYGYNTTTRKATPEEALERMAKFEADGHTITGKHNKIDIKPNQFAYGGEVTNDPPTKKEATISQHTPQPILEKAWDVITNPMTALEHLTKTGSIPDNLDAAVRNGHAERNNLDMALDVVNVPAIARNVANIPADIKKGNYITAAANSLDVIPMGAGAKKLFNKKTADIVTNAANDLLNIRHSVDGAEDIAIAGISPKRAYNRFIERQADKIVNAGQTQYGEAKNLNPKPSALGVLPGMKEAIKKNIDGQHDHIENYIKENVSSPRLAIAPHVAHHDMLTAVDRYRDMKLEAFQRNYVTEHPIIKEYSDYLSFVSNVKGKKLNRQQLGKVLDDPHLVDEFIENQSKGQRAVSNLDSNLSDKEKKKILTEWFTKPGTGWLPNSHYSSNSDEISNMFSRNMVQGREGYIADIRYKWPGLEGKKGKEKLQAYRNMVYLDNHPNFKDVAGERSKPIYQAHYTGADSAERIITKEFFEKHPDIISVENIKRVDEFDEFVKQKMGRAGLGNSKPTDGYFHHNSNFESEYIRKTYPELASGDLDFDFKLKARKRMRQKWDDLQDDLPKIKTQFEDATIALKEQGYPYLRTSDFTDKGKLDRWFKERTNIKSIHENNVQKAIGAGLKTSGTALTGATGYGLYDWYQKDIERKIARREYNQKVLESKPEVVKPLQDSIAKYKELGQELVDVRDRDFFKTLRDDSNYMDIASKMMDTSDPIERLKIEAELTKVRYEAAKKYKKKS